MLLGLQLRSRRGNARLPLLVTQNIRRGTVFMPMHWGFLWGKDAEVNALNHPEVCPISLEPELKACAVQLVPIAPQPATVKLNSAEQVMAMVQPVQQPAKQTVSVGNASAIEQRHCPK